MELLPRLSADQITWTDEQFLPGPRNEYWRLGVGGDTPGEEIAIVLAPETLNTFYGNDAVARIRRAEATLSLLTANPELPPEQVYFGLSLRGVDAEGQPQEVGLYIQVVNLTTINIFSG